MVDLEHHFLSDYKNKKEVTFEEVVDNDSFSIIRVEIIFVYLCSKDFPQRFVGFHHSDDKKRISDGDEIKIS
jgi:hypothetical protein